MRILDCKSPICSEISKDAPVIIDYLCEDCSQHFEQLKSYLTEMEIAFTVNPKIVRGLDYYTKTVFEFVSKDIGAQATICGGGRYDGLIAELGGNPAPALGFAMGIERLIMTMENQGAEFLQPNSCDLYICPMGENERVKALTLTKSLRDEGYWAEYDIMGRTLKAQMKYADKIKAKFVLVIGENELVSGKAKLKEMKTGEQTDISLDGSFIDTFSSSAISGMFENVLDSNG
jgi:histidyl-tRNA synthetase